MEGQVQCIYFDPPYGMDFDANWQGTDGKVVTAFRDRYERGIHSYLDELKESLELCRELLAESGSLFLQIGEVNVHRAAILLDEVFGTENAVRTITYKTTGGGSSTREISKSCDYLLWYAKNKEEMKFRQLYEEQNINEWMESASSYSGIDLPDGTCRMLTREERDDPKMNIQKKAGIWRAYDLTSQGPSDGEQGQPYEWNGTLFGTTGLHARQWSVDRDGLDRLANDGRLFSTVKIGTKEASATKLGFKTYREETPGRRITNMWNRLISPKTIFTPYRPIFAPSNAVF